MERVLPGCLLIPGGRQGPGRTVAGASQLGWREQDPLPRGLERGRLELRGQAGEFEPIDEVVGKQERMEAGLVDEETTGGDAAQGIFPSCCLMSNSTPARSL